MKCVLALVLLACLSCTGCDDREDLGDGLEIINQGGTKHSFARNGSILISYTVTGVGEVGNDVALEARDYGSNYCSYYLYHRDSGKLESFRVRGSAAAIPGKERIVDAVESRSHRSCKHEKLSDETHLATAFAKERQFWGHNT